MVLVAPKRRSCVVYVKGVYVKGVYVKGVFLEGVFSA